VVDRAPGWLVEFGKSVFGLGDKPALVAGTVVLALLFGIGFGLAAARRPSIGVAGFAGFGLLGLAAITADAQGSFGAGLFISLVATSVGIFLLLRLVGLAGASLTAPPEAMADPESSPVITDTPTTPAVSRRSFLNWAGAAGVASVGAVAASRAVQSRSAVSTARDEVVLGEAAESEVADVLAEAELGELASTPGLSPLVTANDDFYLIDTALVKPRVDPETWSMSIHGMVDQELTFTYQELLDRAETVAPVTLSCVSNEVGGDLVGNAVWQGVPLVELLDEAGVHPEATQVASRSVDGWSCGFPTEVLNDGRTALVAVGMNGEPLPVEHGFPARLVVSGLYGYVSATKWLRDIELTTLEGFNGYWVPRGWSKLGPVKTQSRIDTPQRGERVTADTPVAIAGVAWAPDTGITKVEVQVDDGEWQEAELGESLGPDAWRQWFLPWTPPEGGHTIKVRATDESGYTQTQDRAQPAPDGATGWHQINVQAV
jgi:DMSO/TMAO reductase YedYZ molybdopterin-dependent catalytic subunit